MLVKRIAYIPIYLEPITSYSEILVGNCNFILPPCIEGVPIGIRGKGLVLRKLESSGYIPGSEDSLTIG